CGARLRHNDLNELAHHLRAGHDHARGGDDLLDLRRGQHIDLLVGEAHRVQVGLFLLGHDAASRVWYFSTNAHSALPFRGTGSRLVEMSNSACATASTSGTGSSSSEMKNPVLMRLPGSTWRSNRMS